MKVFFEIFICNVLRLRKIVFFVMVKNAMFIFVTKLFFQGFINVRVWFPKLPGVVMMSDQEVIIMCKPPERVVTQNKAAGFAGAL